MATVAAIERRPAPRLGRRGRRDGAAVAFEEVAAATRCRRQRPTRRRWASARRIGARRTASPDHVALERRRGLCHRRCVHSSPRRWKDSGRARLVPREEAERDAHAGEPGARQLVPQDGGSRAPALGRRVRRARAPAVPAQRPLISSISAGSSSKPNGGQWNRRESRGTARAARPPPRPRQVRRRAGNGQPHTGSRIRQREHEVAAGTRSGIGVRAIREAQTIGRPSATR